MLALRSRITRTRTTSRRRYRTIAQIAGGRSAAAARKRRQSSQTSIPTVPARNATFPSHASAASASTRWISLTSLLRRDMISPSGVRAKNRGDSRCRCRYTVRRISKRISAETLV